MEIVDGTDLKVEKNATLPDLHVFLSENNSKHPMNV
jgi:hypothetical protein